MKYSCISSQSASPVLFEFWNPSLQTTITLQKRPPENKQKAGAAHGRRDGWLRKHADQAIVVWNRSDGPIARMVKGLESELGEENVWIIDPNEL